VLDGLLSRLLSSTSSKTTLALLKCLNAIADNLPPAASGQWLPDNRFGNLIFSRTYRGSFKSIIEQATPSLVSQQACDAVIALLCKTASQEWQKRALVEDGVLAALSSRLASFVVSEGLVPPTLEVLSGDTVNVLSMPEPAPASAHLSPVLEAIAVLIDHSKARAKQFLTDPAVKAVLPDPADDFSPSDIRRTPWGGSYFSGAAVPRSRLQGPLDSLLAYMPVSDKKSTASQSGFPPLGSVPAMPKRRSSFLPTTTETPQSGILLETSGETDESLVVPWLLYVVRESRGKRRLLAAKLLVILDNLSFVRRTRSATFGALLVPLLVGMLDKEHGKAEDSHANSGSYLCNGLHYPQAVPAVLAALIRDDPDMQKVAVESKAIAKLSAGLKTTFEVSPRRKPVPWKPHKQDAADVQQTSPLERLGPGGPTPFARQEMAYREGCLQALAAIAPFNDEYRKEICDQGVLTQIIQSLEPYQSHDAMGVDEQPQPQGESSGNSASTLLAACGAVRALTRSVTALRTKLVDAEVAQSIIKLMNSTDPEVRIAATTVLANLAMDFSPMKESVGEAAVVKKLCEQAHSANARLRLESLWALKQLVLNASKKLKQDVVDELGPSWMKLLIKTDPIDIPDGEVIGLVDKEYPPLSTTYRRSSTLGDTSNDIVMSEGAEGQQLHDHAFSTRHTPEDDTAIQEQLLDLIRNLFCGENASDLVRYVFDEMGQDDFFKIMLDRLRPRTLAGATRKENQTTPPPNEIVVKVLYILVHVAACDPKWRNTIASHHGLMKQVLTFCNHAEREIRAQCCWIAINLIYEDDAGDRPACKHRAAELQKVGFLSHVQKLENDSDLDVRERAKTAIQLMSQMMGS